MNKPTPRTIHSACRLLLAVCWLTAGGLIEPLHAQEGAVPAMEEVEPIQEEAEAADFAGQAAEDSEATEAADFSGDQEAADGALDLGGEEEAAGGALDYTLMELIHFGGTVGYLIILLSFVAVALMVDDALLLRRGVLMPPDEVGELKRLVEQSHHDQVTEGDRSSFVGAMTSAGVAEQGHGYESVVKAMEDCADGLTGRLLRRIEYLNIIANVAPMLGLLGTVIGMVKCFNQISVAAGGVDPRLLAGGIFQALMTTVMGLIVAIPSLFAFSLFRNRVDALVAEATQIAEEIVAPLRPPGREGVPTARLTRVSN